MMCGPDYCQTKNKELCCGCTACMMACPVNAIRMERDHEGFLYPVLDTTVCIDCHLCERVCPFGQNKSVKTPIQTWAAVHKDSDILKSSSSGGVFSALSEVVLEENGAVAGAVIRNNEVFHCIAENKKDAAQMRGSKYVQSDLRDVLKQVHGRVKAGETVLFSGTPCQCAAARKLVGENDKLLTVDFVCHGVPSPAVWADYVKYRAALDGSAPQYISLRAKRPHQMGYFENYLDGNNKNHHIPAYESPYLTGFLAGLYNRPSCYACPYACKERASDITICDYWGYRNHHDRFAPEDGISAVLVNTDRGLKWWERASQAMECHASSLGQIAEENANLNRTTVKPAQRDAFFQDWETQPFSVLSQKYLTDPQAGKKKLIASIPYSVKKILRKLRS